MDLKFSMQKGLERLRFEALKTLNTKKRTPRAHLRENVGSICCGCCQRGEESGFSCRLDGVNHPQLDVFQVSGLPIGVDEDKDIVHAWGEKRGRKQKEVKKHLQSTDLKACVKKCKGYSLLDVESGCCDPLDPYLFPYLLA